MMRLDKKKLEEKGIHFLRFDDLEVKQNREVIINDIISWIEQNHNLA